MCKFGGLDPYALGLKATLTALANLKVVLEILNGRVGGSDPVPVIVVGILLISARFMANLPERNGKKRDPHIRI